MGNSTGLWSHQHQLNKTRMALPGDPDPEWSHMFSSHTEKTKEAKRTTKQTDTEAGKPRPSPIKGYNNAIGQNDKWGTAKGGVYLGISPEFRDHVRRIKTPKTLKGYFLAAETTLQPQHKRIIFVSLYLPPMTTTAKRKNLQTTGRHHSGDGRTHNTRDGRRLEQCGAQLGPLTTT